MIITVDFRFSVRKFWPSFIYQFHLGSIYLMFINGLNWDVSILVRRTRMKWEIRFTPDLVKLAKWLYHTLDESLKGKAPKCFIFNSSK